MFRDLFLGLAQFATILLSAIMLEQQRAGDLVDYQKKRLDAQADALQEYVARHNLDLELEEVKQINRLAELTHKADLDLTYLSEKTAEALELERVKDEIGDENVAQELRDAKSLDAVQTDNDIFRTQGGWPGIFEKVMGDVDDTMYRDQRFFKQASEDYPLLPGDIPERNLELYGGSIKDWTEDYARAVDPIFAAYLDLYQVPDEVRPALWTTLRTGPNETFAINGNDAEVGPPDQGGSGVPKTVSGVLAKGFPGMVGSGLAASAWFSRWMPDTQRGSERGEIQYDEPALPGGAPADDPRNPVARANDWFTRGNLLETQTSKDQERRESGADDSAKQYGQQPTGVPLLPLDEIRKMAKEGEPDLTIPQPPPLAEMSPIDVGGQRPPLASGVSGPTADPLQGPGMAPSGRTAGVADTELMDGGMPAFARAVGMEKELLSDFPSATATQDAPAQVPGIQQPGVPLLPAADERRGSALLDVPPSPLDALMEPGVPEAPGMPPPSAEPGQLPGSPGVGAAPGVPGMPGMPPGAGPSSEPGMPAPPSPLDALLEPGMPGAPGQPPPSGAPGQLPGSPGVSDAPGVPGIPGIPPGAGPSSEPDFPLSAPGQPPMPGTPAAPGMPPPTGEPGQPAPPSPLDALMEPGVPGAPGMPSPSGAPGMPAPPSPLDAILEPGMPGAPGGMPPPMGTPGTPGSPGAPPAQGVPGQPSRPPTLGGYPVGEPQMPGQPTNLLSMLPPVPAEPVQPPQAQGPTQEPGRPGAPVQFARRPGQPDQPAYPGAAAGPSPEPYAAPSPGGGAAPVIPGQAGQPQVSGPVQQPGMPPAPQGPGSAPGQAAQPTQPDAGGPQQEPVQPLDPLSIFSPLGVPSVPTKPDQPQPSQEPGIPAPLLAGAPPEQPGVPSAPAGPAPYDMPGAAAPPDTVPAPGQPAIPQAPGMPQAPDMTHAIGAGLQSRFAQQQITPPPLPPQAAPQLDQPSIAEQPAGLDVTAEPQPDFTGGGATTKHQVLADFLVQYEGFSPDIYDDNGRPSWGYGTSPSSEDVAAGNSITEPEARREKMDYVRDTVDRDLGVLFSSEFMAGLADNQYAALGALIYNRGLSQQVYEDLQPLVQALESGNVDKARALWLDAHSLPPGHRYYNGVRNRRNAEIGLYYGTA